MKLDDFANKEAYITKEKEIKECDLCNKLKFTPEDILIKRDLACEIIIDIKLLISNCEKKFKII